MKNLKVTRKLRGQSASGLRKKLRKSEKALSSEIRRHNTTTDLLHHYQAENMKMRRAMQMRKEIKIGSGMLDTIMDKFVTELARELVLRLFRDNPVLAREWKYGIQQAAAALGKACYRQTSSTFCMNDSFMMHVWEGVDNQDLHFDFKVTNISNHKTLPREARKAQIMSDPHQRMYVLDEVDEYFVGTGIGDKEVKVVGIFR